MRMLKNPPQSCLEEKPETPEKYHTIVANPEMQKDLSNNCDKTRNAEEVSHNCHKTRSAEKVFTIVKLTRDHKDGRCGPFGNTPLLHELTWLWECQAYCNSCHQSCSHQQNSN
jgi:hypothetical protein